MYFSTQPVIRLYAVPMSTFTNEDEEDAEVEEMEELDSAN